MKRDMELLRKILFTIEEKYKPGDGYIFMLKIDGYDMQTIAEHCDLLYQQGLVQSYKPQLAGNGIYTFSVGNITSVGYDYLELIRSDDIWNKTKTEIEEKKYPKTIEWIAKIAGIFTGNLVKELSN